MEGYTVIPITTLDAYKLSTEHTLTQEEVIKLFVHKKLLKKFIEQKALSIQFDIWNWKWEGKEAVWLETVKQLATVAKEIWNIKNIYDEFSKKQEELKKEEEDKKAQKQKKD